MALGRCTYCSHPNKITKIPHSKWRTSQTKTYSHRTLEKTSHNIWNTIFFQFYEVSTYFLQSVQWKLGADLWSKRWSIFSRQSGKSLSALCCCAICSFLRITCFPLTVRLMLVADEEDKNRHKTLSIFTIKVSQEMNSAVVHGFSVATT